MDELISVIVPVYNVENYLRRCIDSILNQTYQNLEIILIDDGSTDSSSIICDEYANMYDRIVVIHKKNGGLSDARNTGLKKMSGTYFICVDSDDYILPNCIEYLYGLAIEYNADIAICNHTFSFENGNFKDYKVEKRNKIYTPYDAINEILYQGNFTHSAWAKLYCKNVANDVYYPVGQLYEDICTTTRFILNSNKVVFGYKSMYIYTIRSNSIMTVAFNKNKFDLIKQVNNLENILSKYRCFLKAFKSFRFSMYCHLFYQISDSYEIERHNIFNLIKSDRLSILFDRNTRFKNKLAAIISLLGYKINVLLGGLK